MKTKTRIGYLAAAFSVVLTAVQVHAAQNSRLLVAQSGDTNLKMKGRGPAGPGPQGEREIVTFLGVETAPVSETLGEQLGLPRDSGLVVVTVMPDSPAAGALKPHDVLVKLDDQILVDSRQFSVLVRNHKEGDEVSFTYVRSGKQGTAKVKLGKHEVPKLAMKSGDGPMPARPMIVGRNLNGPRDSREEMDRVLGLIQQGPGESRLAEIQRGGARADRREGPGLRATNVNPGNSNMVFTDEQGSLDLTIKDGKKTLVAKNPAGEPIFSGPVNTPEERKALPPQVRDRLNKIEGMQEFTFRTDDGFVPSGKTIRAYPQGIVFPAPAPRDRVPPAAPQLF